MKEKLLKFLATIGMYIILFTIIIIYRSYRLKNFLYNLIKR